MTQPVTFTDVHDAHHEVQRCVDNQSYLQAKIKEDLQRLRDIAKAIRQRKAKLVKERALEADLRRKAANIAAAYETAKVEARSEKMKKIEVLRLALQKLEAGL